MYKQTQKKKTTFLKREIEITKLLLIVVETLATSLLKPLSYHLLLRQKNFHYRLRSLFPEVSVLKK